jgi:hypothetical protein
MGKINVGRLILSGIIIAVIVDVIEGISNALVLAPRWTAALAAINQPPFTTGQIVGFNIYGLIVGLMAAWIYAGFRPRFGPGHLTAVYAALTTWVLGYGLAYLALGLLVMPADLMVTIGVVGLVEIVVATLVGTYFYQEA